MRWQERQALDPQATVWSTRLWVNWGGPCILCSKDCKAFSASGLSGEAGTWVEEVNIRQSPYCLQAERGDCLTASKQEVVNCLYCKTRTEQEAKIVVLPSLGLVGDAVLSLLESKAILFRASMALPAFYEWKMLDVNVAKDKTQRLKRKKMLPSTSAWLETFSSSPWTDTWW